MPLKFNKATDSEHKEKLESSLISVSWKGGAAYIGGKAAFAVLTAFVGNGAPIKVTGKSEKGKKLAVVQGTMKDNTFLGEFDIPDSLETDDFVFFEADLSKNGLNEESNHIPVRPPIKATNMKWSAKEARRGDVLTLSADIEGVADGTEAKITIYEFDQDGASDKIVEIPAAIKDHKIEFQWEYEYHEDTDEIPSDEELKNYGSNYNPPEYFFTIKIEGQEFGKKQESGLLEFKDWLEVRLVDREGNPIPDRDYTVTLPDGTQKTGKTDADGYVRVADVPPGECKVEFQPPQAESQGQAQ